MTLPKNVLDIIALVEETRRLPDGSSQCILCSNPHPEAVGVWWPDERNQRRIGCAAERLADGGARLVVYLICEVCLARPTSGDEVEVEIVKRVGVQ
jgi:hypothetical protein